jgi:hypothetical protein
MRVPLVFLGLVCLLLAESEAKKKVEDEDADDDANDEAQPVNVDLSFIAAAINEEAALAAFKAHVEAGGAMSKDAG